jgi:hypothetical protein
VRLGPSVLVTILAIAILCLGPAPVLAAAEPVAPISGRVAAHDMALVGHDDMIGHEPKSGRPIPPDLPGPISLGPTGKRIYFAYGGPSRSGTNALVRALMGELIASHTRR